MTDTSRILATYRIFTGGSPTGATGDGADAKHIEARAAALALEQSVEMPDEAVTDPWVRERIVGRVQDIRHVALGQCEVDIALAAETVDGDPGQLMNMLMGNCSLQPDVELTAVNLPASLKAALPGPRFGIDGWRETLGLRSPRALTCAALKPQGLSPERLAALATVLAEAGIDVIKDDHGIADQRYAPFADRVRCVQQAIDQVNARRKPRSNGQTAARTIYAPSLSGGPARLERQLELIERHRVGAALVCPMLIGIPCFSDWVRSRSTVPLLAHPALAGAQRIAAPLLLGTLFRHFGADATIFPNAGGRFAFTQARCDEIADRARAPDAIHRPCLPVPAGGMTVERVPELLRHYGNDSMLLIGGDLLRASQALPQRARAFVDAVRQGSSASARIHED